MSIAEKLTTIAENEQRVYEAGVQKGIVSAIPTIYEEQTPQWITESDLLFGVANGVYLDVGELAVYKGLKICAEIYNEEGGKGDYGYPIYLRIEDGAAERLGNLCICEKALNYNAEKKCFEAEVVIYETPKNNQVKIGIWIYNEHIEEISPFGHIKITTYDPTYAEYFYKRAEWSYSWDFIQDSGNRQSYDSFCSGNKFIVDKDTTPRFYMYPKYDLYPTNANWMFRELNATATGGKAYKNIAVDLTQWLSDLGVKLDMSRCTNVNSMFYNCYGFTRVPFLDLSKCTSLTYFMAFSSIKTIDGIKSSETTAWNNNSFYTDCGTLTHCIFEGVIAKSLKLSTTNLDRESLLSVLNCLKDLSGTGTTLTLTLGTTLLAKLTDTEKAIATQKGWTLA